MSNTTNITNEPYLTESLLMEYFKYQILSETTNYDEYSANIKTNNISNISSDIMKFCDYLDFNIPVVIIGIDINQNSINPNVHHFCAYQLASYYARTIKNPIIITDNYSFYSSVRWYKDRYRTIKIMNPMMMMVIN